ncbi:dihydrofolate reductase family protein [Actinomadura alba]|uniref:Dihydrofolate reductase family protein n=1 Tax=Actinomadura alba TaxID=406431 RepID=A0ABR7LP24_9ACTN|nr:dihydrofolate reductase family protein [Actinomadura alba]MBC6466539.1 dihydrofolate reductase family protein [Actinomadura alba]
MLHEEPGLPSGSLTSTLAMTYGGDLGFTESCLYANFVASLDGVVALGSQDPSSGSAISGGEPEDRFVMGLLRAFADVVLIGAGTLRATAGHRWTPEHVYPAAAADFADLRRRRGRTAGPELAVVTASGDVPTGHPGLRAGALIATTTAGARLLDKRPTAACTVVALGEGPTLRMADVLRVIRARGHTMVLTEGGPRLFGNLVRDHLVDELFLTVSPVVAGRAGTSRPGLVAGLELLPGRWETAELISVRGRASYLFLRYRLHRTHDRGGDHGGG